MKIILFNPELLSRTLLPLFDTMSYYWSCGKRGLRECFDPLALETGPWALSDYPRSVCWRHHLLGLSFQSLEYWRPDFVKILSYRLPKVWNSYLTLRKTKIIYETFFLRRLISFFPPVLQAIASDQFSLEWGVQPTLRAGEILEVPRTFINEYYIK